MARTGILYREYLPRGAYRGRFAPTPSGPLHFGSLVAAAGSYLDARRNKGEWLVRIEDLDPPRVVPGSAEGILHTLRAFGFEWDGEILWQSTRLEAYQDALERLQERGLCYPCVCSRAGCVRGCREEGVPASSAVSWRVRAEDEPDFVIRRADGVFSYHLAVVVDDAEQGITDVVRGADLLDCTPRQNYLQKLLGYPIPRYKHLPIARNAMGEKLSKQTHAPAISANGDPAELRAAFHFLGLEPPQELTTLTGLWRWGFELGGCADSDPHRQTRRHTQ